LGQVAHAQLRVVTYNTTGGPNAGLATVLEAIGQEIVNGFAKPIDVLAVQEQTSSATTTQAIVDLLNAIYGPETYARGHARWRRRYDGSTPALIALTQLS
jgi:hypothetical protein